jgi:hypothetical protein
MSRQPKFGNVNTKVCSKRVPEQCIDVFDKVFDNIIEIYIKELNQTGPIGALTKITEIESLIHNYSPKTATTAAILTPKHFVQKVGKELKQQEFIKPIIEIPDEPEKQRLKISKPESNHAENHTEKIPVSRTQTTRLPLSRQILFKK